jgi:hypothetical protein
MPMTMPTHMHMTRSYSFSSMLSRVSMHISALGDLWLVVKMVFIVMGCLYDFMRPLVGRRWLMVMSCCCCCPSGHAGTTDLGVASVVDAGATDLGVASVVDAGATDLGVASVVDAGATDLGVASVVGCCSQLRGVVVGRGHVLNASVSVGSAVVVDCGVAALVDLGGGPVFDAGLSVASVMVNCTVPAIVDSGGGPARDVGLSVPPVMVDCTVYIHSVLSRRHPLVMFNGTSLAISVPCCLSVSCHLSLLPMMMN